MIRLIAHRGNLRGIDRRRENTWAYLKEALDAGFDVEVDIVWRDNTYFLGHQLYTNLELMVLEIWDYKDRIWFHAKTVTTLYKIRFHDVNAFYHDEDPCVLTTKGIMWNHVRSIEISPGSIVVLPEMSGILDHEPDIYGRVFGICTDLIYHHERKANENGFNSQRIIKNI